MIRRGVSEDEFKRLSVEEYLHGDYGINLAAAEELAEVEWQIRLEVEGIRRMPTGVRKSSNSHAGFGLKGLWLGEKEKKPQHHPTNKEILISKVAYKALRTKVALSTDDISWLLSGEVDFLTKFARPLGFPAYEPRLKGYRTWRVYDWLASHSKRGKIKVKA